MNKLVIFNYSLIRALNSLFKCYELAVRERAKAHVLVCLRGANGMVLNGHVICIQLILLIRKPVRLPAFLALQCYPVGCSRIINPLTDYPRLTSPTHK